MEAKWKKKKIDGKQKAVLEYFFNFFFTSFNGFGNVK